MNKSILGVFLILLGHCSLLAAQAEDFSTPASQSLSILKEKVEQYMLNELATNQEHSVKVTAGRLDSRLKLRACPEEHLEVFNPYNTALFNTNSMGIKCSDTKNHWTVYVPIKVTLFKKVVLTRQALRKGDKITSTVLYLAEMDVQKLKQGYFTDPKDLMGLVANRDIAPNTPLTPYISELAKLVHKGQEVLIVATAGNLRITMPGTALNDGTLGEVIKIRNNKSNKIVEAQVSGANEARVTL